MNWSQTDLGRRLGITQRAVYMIEHARVEVRKSTAAAVDELFDQLGIQFEPLPDGGFQIMVSGRIFESLPNA
jgi:hypothetical protein